MSESELAQENSVRDRVAEEEIKGSEIVFDVTFVKTLNVALELNEAKKAEIKWKMKDFEN